MKNIVNIINFVRAVEPRQGRNIDMQLPMREQIRLMRENGLRGTFLLQYDTLIDPAFDGLINEAAEFCEIGLWLEIVQPQTEAVGIEWEGRFPWDWHNDVGFLIGYEPEERYRLIDVAMERFKERFGKYPESVGSWHIDAVSLKYLDDKYHISASCNCRDQVGTDGYTMQGGYYNQAYYPSVSNMFCPASTKEKQINIPVFRMLGSDPTLAYDYQVFDYGSKHVPSLEPVHYGKDPDWVNWFTDMLYERPNGLCFQYTQVGQENSFGWPNMREGLEYQFPHIARLAREGKVEVMTLGESGRWFKENFETTPPATLSALKSWKRPNISSIWYYSRFYRVNLVLDNGIARIRDMYLFDENYPERYLDKRCASTACEFRNLPIMDGSIYSDAKSSTTAGIYFMADGQRIAWKDIDYKEYPDGRAEVTLTSDKGVAVMSFEERGFEISTDVEGLSLMPEYDAKRVAGCAESGEKFVNDNNKEAVISFIDKAASVNDRIEFTINGFDYGLTVAEGTVSDGLSVTEANGKIKVIADNR